MDREEAAKELMAMLEEAQEGPYYSEEEVRAHLLEILAPRNQVYMTGDTHGQFERVIEFCARREVEPENTLVILGDAGLNYCPGTHHILLPTRQSRDAPVQRARL